MIVQQDDNQTILKEPVLLPNSNFQTQRPVSLREYVETSLRQKIASGELRPGSRLVERELCDTFNVSRTLIREAIRKLEAEKLITVIPYKGPIVSLIDQETTQELYSVRRLLEGYAVNLFTQRASAPEIKKLEHTVERLRQLVGQADAQSAMLEVKDAFYTVILHGCGNEVLQELFITILSRINLYRPMSMGAAGRPYQSYLEIKAIYDNIAARDAVAAQAAAEAHVENARVIVLAALQAKKTPHMEAPVSP